MIVAPTTRGHEGVAVLNSGQQAFRCARVAVCVLVNSPAQSFSPLEFPGVYALDSAESPTGDTQSWTVKGRPSPPPQHRHRVLARAW